MSEPDLLQEQRDAVTAQLLMELASTDPAVLTALRKAFDAGSCAGIDAALAVLRGTGRALDEAAGRKPNEEQL